MRTMLNLLLAGVFTAAVASPYFAATAKAQDTKNQDTTNVAVAHVLKSGDIIGLPVRNKAGEDIGNINDLVVDMKTGEIRYAALSFGGFAGFGSKLFAVPFGAMTFVFGEPNKANSRHFVFDVNKDQLDRAHGFDSSNWPNVADAKWGEAIDKHYKFDRKPDTTTAATTGEGANVKFETVFRASKIKGMDVRNDKNENLGSVNELVIDITKGHVKYVALSYGSWFTGDHKLFAVPLSALTLNHANDKTFFLAHVSQENLKNAPGFTNWPNTADPNWAKSIDTYYERTATRRDTIQK
jgi:sporulation protein YlmC with PRC-barrel domain